MKIPKKLKVGGHTYSVNIVRASDDKKGLHNWGKTTFRGQNIYLDRELTGTLLGETFLHELLHTATQHCGMDTELGDEKEEHLVRRLAATLYMIFTDNKMLK